MKIFEPGDFPKPPADARRQEILNLVELEINSNRHVVTYGDSNTTLEVNIVDSGFTTEQLIDFQSFYARQGKWTKVEASRFNDPTV